jgi:hypothetical protein
MSLILNGTNGLSDVDGSASTPAVRGTDTNTGIFFPAADTIAFAEGGAEVARFDSSGNLGLGTDTPLSKLDVVVGGSTRRFLVNFDDSIITNKASNNSSNPENLRVVAETVRFNTGTTGSGTERMRIDSSGNLLVGATSSSSLGAAVAIQALQGGFLYSTSNNNASGGFARRGSDGDVVIFRRDTTTVGSISVTGSSTSYNTSSDYRLKENIAPMTGALAVVGQLKPCTYTWKADGSDGQGFIAHELAEVVPDCVTGEKDAVDAEGNPKYQGIDTSFLVATLTAAIQEQQAIITDLKSRIEALEQA